MRNRFLIISSLLDKSSYRITVSLAAVFVPLGCLGLMRLPAAFWLSSDYGFMKYEIFPSAPLLVETELEKVVSDNNLKVRVSQVNTTVQDRLLPPHCWKGVLYRVFWLATVWAILGISAADCAHLWWNYPPSLPYLSTSELIFNSMYLVLTIATIGLHTFYVVTGKATSTIIPCIHDVWYKIFTGAFMVAALVCVVVASLETRSGEKGGLTCLPEFLCGKSGDICVPVSWGQGNYNI